MSGRHVLAVLALVALSSVAAVAQGGAIHGSVTVPSTGITSVLVYLIPEAVSGILAIKPETTAMDQRDLRFVPGVVAVPPGSTVVFSNSDRVMHNVFHPWQSSAGFDLGLWAPGESRKFLFGKEGAYVILCQVHPEMVGYVVVVASPYRALTDDHGQFHLDGVAPGTYRLRTWHHRLATHEEHVTIIDGGSARIDMTLKFGKAAAPAAMH